MRGAALAILTLFAWSMAGCEVDQMLCIDLLASELDPRTGCVTRGTTAVPGSRCIECPDGGCGIDLRCVKSSCVVDPEGRVYVLFCIDAAMREWPKGWRPIRRRDIPDDPALTDAQRSTCLSAAVHERYCKGS